MPLRIRCPHCQAVAVVPDDAAGEQRPCDTCRVSYTVPLPSRAVSGVVDVADVSAACPRCRAAVAPGTAHCPSCLTDLATGERIAWSRRIRAFGAQRGTLLGLAVVTCAALVWVAVRAFLDARHSSNTPPAVFQPIPRVEIPADPIAARLFAARSADDRRSATAELAPLLPAAGSALALALDRSLREADSPGRRAAQLAAIALLAARPAEVAVPALERAGDREALRDEALRSRALLGDARILAEVAQLWHVRLRRSIFLSRCAELGGLLGRNGAQAAVRSGTREADRYAAALRRLGRPAIDQLAADLWRTWPWLGQHRDQACAAALFQVAMPAPANDLDVQSAVTENVRAARDALKATAAAGPPAARAAAALVLKQCAPQYESARERIIAALAGMLAASDPSDQQRIVWTLATLTGRTFGRVSADGHPADADRAAVVAALDWIRAARLAPNVRLRTRDIDYAGRPHLTRRVYTARRQWEDELLRGLRGNTAAANTAAEAWIASDLPWTPRLAELLSPAQRHPHNPALAGVIAIAASRADSPAARALEIWSEAADQPGWVRNLARTALAAITLRDGRAVTRWPANLDAASLAALDDADPGWAPFGRAIAAGGEPLFALLREATPDALPQPLRDRLLRAAEHALRSQGDAPRR